MNDRFRFRAWNVCDDDLKGGMLYDVQNDTNFDYFLDSKKLVVEQCTGLKDKNGRLIYEGDIIRLPWQAGWPDLIGVVKFNELYACFLLSKTITDRAEQSFWWNDSKEVIGNIHENPELLEDK